MTSLITIKKAKDPSDWFQQQLEKHRTQIDQAKSELTRLETTPRPTLDCSRVHRPHPLMTLVLTMWERIPPIRKATGGEEDDKLQQDLTNAIIHGNERHVVRLLATGANPCSKNKNGETPLHASAKRGHTTCLWLLLAAGALPSSQNKDDETPLHAAAQQGHAKCLWLLLAAGSSLSAKNKIGGTPLHYAAMEGKTQCVQLLLAAGADPSGKDMDGWTPLQYATYNSKTACERQLVDRNRQTVPLQQLAALVALRSHPEIVRNPIGGTLGIPHKVMEEIILPLMFG